MSSPTTDALKRTPLYEQHRALGANLVPFGGWEMPLQYGAQIKEHLATRQGVGIFDVSHMGQVEVRGAAAAELVSHLVSRNAEKIAPGEVKYALLMNDDGGLRDDLMINRLARERFLLVVNAATFADDVAYLQSVAAGIDLDAVLRPCAEDYAMIAIQGPQWLACAAPALGVDAAKLDLPPMRVATLKRGGAELIFSTTGYTGERGIELMCPPAQVPEIWNALLAAGATPVGLAARDSLRMEKGMPLSGQDFTTANNPFEAGLAWGVDLPGRYPGAAALERIKAAGTARKFVGFVPQGKRIARHGAAVMKDGKTIGEITSGGFSPTLERPMALGYIDAEYAAAGTDVELDLGRNTKVPAVVESRRHVK